MRIPVENERWFRRKSSTDSDLNRAPIPAKSSTDSGEIEHPGSGGAAHERNGGIVAAFLGGIAMPREHLSMRKIKKFSDRVVSMIFRTFCWVVAPVSLYAAEKAACLSISSSSGSKI